jgi:hypothetical protein
MFLRGTGEYMKKTEKERQRQKPTKGAMLDYLDFLGMLEPNL